MTPNSPPCANVLLKMYVLCKKMSCAGCPGPSPAILAQFTLKMYVAARNHKKTTKTPYFGGSGSFKVIDVDINKKLTALLLVMISSLSVPICSRFHATRVNCGKITTFRGVCLTPACAGLLDSRVSGLRLLKSTFNAENFIHRLSWSISSHFVPIRVEMCAASKNCEIFTKTPFGGSRSFKVIDIDKSKKSVTCACYDKQHVYTYLQPFSHYTSQ